MVANVVKKELGKVLEKVWNKDRSIFPEKKTGTTVVYAIPCTMPLICRKWEELIEKLLRVRTTLQEDEGVSIGDRAESLFRKEAEGPKTLHGGCEAVVDRLPKFVKDRRQTIHQYPPIWKKSINIYFESCECR